MKYRKLIILVVAIIAAIAVGSKLASTSDPGNATSQNAVDDHGHDHGQGQEKSSQVTVWNDRFEIFMEHPFVVANKPTKFVTHVTDRITLKPRRKGSVTFVLTDNDGISKRYVDKTPARDGIYIPMLTFLHSGIWDLSLDIVVEGKKYVIKLPAIKVYRSQAEVDLAPCPEEITGISFLKEQQWKLPFATEVTQQKMIHSQAVLAVPESAIIDESGTPIAFVQLAGETFEKRYLKLGKKDHGLVQVSSGLSEGEYVTTKGAYAIVEAKHELHNDESIMEMSQEDMDRFGIEVDKAGPGKFEVRLNVPGQLVINTDRMAHIVPTVPGIVRQVLKKLGDTVKAGEIIAWLESSELGKAKIDYIGKWTEVSCCGFDLTRAQQIHDNTVKMLELLKTSPTLETLQTTNGTAMGANRSKLVSAYAEYSFAQAAYLREKPLFEQKITSEQDFLTAQNAFKKADAQYTAVRDSIAFQVQRDLLEAQRAQQLKKMQLKGAERQLKLFGVTDKDIRDLELLAQNQNAVTAGTEDDCTDPNCKECAIKKQAQDKIAADSARADENLARYPLRAPFGGTIIRKHITLGEMVKDDAEVFVVADLSTVWLDLQVHQKDVIHIEKGQKAAISAKSHIPKTTAVIDYIDPVIDKKTRTALARLTLDNSSGRLRPGMFITADIVIENRNANVVVPNSSLQDIDDQTCVFVKDSHGFEPRNVTTGRSNGEKTEIISGLKPGELIVTKNSFRLKAELEKNTGGGHAGHGHAH